MENVLRHEKQRYKYYHRHTQNKWKIMPSAGLMKLETLMAQLIWCQHTKAEASACDEQRASITAIKRIQDNVTSKQEQLNNEQ